MATYQIELKGATYQVEMPDGSESKNPEDAVKGESSKPGKSTGYEHPSNAPTGVSTILPGLTRGVTKGGQDLLDLAGNTAQLTGIANDKTPIIGQDFRNQSRQALDELIPPVKGVMGNVAQGIAELPAAALPLELGGDAIPAAVKFALMGGINARQKGAGGMALEAAKQAVIGQLLHLSGQTGNPALSGALGAGIMGGAAKLQGASDDDAASQAIIGGGLGALQNKGIDTKAPIKSDLPGSAAVKKSFNELTSDRVQDQIDKLNELKRTKGTQISSLDSKEAETAQAAVLNDTMLSDLKAKQERVDAGEDKLKQVNSDLSGKLSGLKAQEPLQVKQQAEAIKAKADADLEVIKQSEDKAAIEKATNETNVTRDISDKSTAIGQELDNVQSQIKSSPIKAAQQIQYRLQKMLEGVYAKYKKGYEKIGNEIDNRVADPNSSSAEGFNPDTPISIEEGNSVITNTKNLLTEDGYGSDHPFMKSLNTIGRRIAKSTIEGSSEGQLAETISFKSLHNAVKQALSGEGVGSHEADVLRSQFGDLISAKLKGSSIGDAFEQLQTSYRPVAELNRTVKRLFSPSGTISSLKGGEGFMEKVAKGNLDGVDTGVLRFLERGEVPVVDKPGEFKPSKFTSGLGDVSSELSKMGKRFDELTKQKMQLGDERAARLSAIGSEYAEKLRQLNNQGQLTQERLNSEIGLMKDKLAVQFAKERMDIELRQQRIDRSLEILSNRKGELKGKTTAQINAIKDQVRIDHIKMRMDLELRKSINEKQLNKMEARKARINSLEKMTNALGLFGGFRIYRIVRGTLMFKGALRHIKK